MEVFGHDPAFDGNGCGGELHESALDHGCPDHGHDIGEVAFGGWERSSSGYYYERDPHGFYTGRWSN